MDLIGNTVITRSNKGQFISNIKKQSGAIVLDKSAIRAAAIK